ncbi:hypothetical protein [Nitrosospira sp. Nsp14]|uniref:hypothetical protein n=1 Tax=Nitrosospira sp. Nsp14 TaxID=1855333 RepID=UPI0015A5AFD3|nr:hypothetical protein [Nitrosospira sp. Nsp14]
MIKREIYLAKTNKNSFRLDADFTEDTVGFAIESFLSVLSFPRLRFSIKPFSRRQERWLGADARLDGYLKSFKPFYMQFKRPSAYPDISTAKVIADREKLRLPVSPHTLYFELRKKREQHYDYQHNVLYRLRKRLLSAGVGDAAYVCPLFLERSAYRFHVHMSGLMLWPIFWRSSPWELEEILISSTSGEIKFDQVPVLREHISIPPHSIVSDAKHSYSFTEGGSDLCFHSPLALPDVGTSLTSFLAKVAGTVQDDHGFISINDAGRRLRELFAAEDNAENGFLLPESMRANDNGLEAWLYWGDYLRQEFGIEQFALVRW